MQSTQAQDIVRKAVAAFNSGRHQDAQKLCEQGLARQPLEPTLNHLLAAMLFARGELSSARGRISASLAANPKSLAALLLAGRIARAEKDFTAALVYLKSAAALGTTPEILLETARTLDQAGTGSDARPAWRAVLQALPQSHEAMARLGRLCWEDGKLDEAASLLERAVVGDCPASTWFNLGVARQDLGDYAGAVTAYRQALTKNPAYAEAAVNLGIALQESGDVDSAMAAYRTAYQNSAATFGTIAMALTSAPNGRLWLNEQALHDLLGG
jgi:tetratricopeptide (TPR) repeat protein